MDFSFVIHFSIHTNKQTKNFQFYFLKTKLLSFNHLRDLLTLHNVAYRTLEAFEVSFNSVCTIEGCYEIYILLCSQSQDMRKTKMRENYMESEKEQALKYRLLTQFEPKPDKPLNQLYTVAEVAEYFACSTKTICRWLQNGKLKGIKPGGRDWRIPQSELDRFIKLQNIAGSLDSMEYIAAEINAAFCMEIDINALADFIAGEQIKAREKCRHPKVPAKKRKPLPPPRPEDNPEVDFDDIRKMLKENDR